MGIGSPSLYAAFGSKEALYAESLRHYRETNEAFVWAGFYPPARPAKRSCRLLMDSAAALTGCVADILAAAWCRSRRSATRAMRELGELVRSARAVTLDRLEVRLGRAVAEGEVPASLDVHALARFVQTVQSGMSILARDGASRAELESVAQVAMLGWDARIGDDDGARLSRAMRR